MNFIHEKCRDKVEKTADKRKVFAIMRESDAEIPKEVDSIFNEPVSEKVFGKVSVFALGGGLPVWVNFMIALVDEVNANTDNEKKLSPAALKYLDKYKNKK